MLSKNKENILAPDTQESKVKPKTHSPKPGSRKSGIPTQVTRGKAVAIKEESKVNILPRENTMDCDTSNHGTSLDKRKQQLKIVELEM